MRHRNPIHCIVPPHVLRALLEQKDKRLRDIALRTLTASVRIRERRTVLAQVPMAVPTGEKQRTIYDLKGKVHPLPGELVRSEGDNPSSDDAVNDAYDGLGATYDLYHDVYHRNSIDDHGMRLSATVHYDEGYDNAFWDGRQMIFGDGDEVIFVGFTKAIDVIGHELTHGVTQFTANLDYHNQSGALNESFSDVFGSLVKQYHNHQDAASADWLIGAGILAPGVNGKALRSMKAPGTAYNDSKLGGKDPQPADMEHFVELSDTDEEDNGGVHINSGIPNRAFFLVAEQLGGYAWEKAGQIWYDTLRQLWHNAQFQDCADVSFQVAGRLYGTGSQEQQAVRSAWSEVGLTVTEGGTRGTGTGRAPRPKHRERAAAHNGNGALKKQLERLASELRKTIETL
jgi:Zn-dependent metalloprotease